MPHLTINGVRYVFDDFGSGPPIVLLHGFTGSRENWRPAMVQLAKEYRVIAPDLLGHGESDAPTDPERYRIEHAAADLAGLIHALKIDRVHLLGYSMGGRLALFSALHNPDQIRSLVLESSTPGLALLSAREQRREADRSLADRIEADGIERFVDEWERLPLWRSQKRLDRANARALREQRLNNRPHGLANSLRGMGSGAQPSLWERLPGLIPLTLLIAGEDDSKFVTINKQMDASIRYSRFVIVPESGHAVHLENPAAFWQTVRHFWQREAVVGD